MRYLLLGVLLSGCIDGVYVYRECLDLNSETARKFVVDCATAANPHSDEEGEDLVRECVQAAETFACARFMWKVKACPGMCDAIPCSIAQGDWKRACELEIAAYNRESVGYQGKERR